MNVFTRALTAIAVALALVAGYLALAERVAGMGATTTGQGECILISLWDRVVKQLQY